MSKIVKISFSTQAEKDAAIAANKANPSTNNVECAAALQNATIVANQ
jgi:hypothetical protein